VVGNGFHTASSTRTSLGVFTLQGLPFAHLAPDFAGRSLHTLGCTAKALAGVSRYPSVGESFVFQCAFSFRLTFSRFLIRFAHRPPLLAKQPLPPELCALVQLPVPQWLPRLFTGLSTVMDHVAAVFAVTVRSALPPRCPPPLPLLRRPCDLRPLIPLLFSSILRISFSRLSV